MSDDDILGRLRTVLRDGAVEERDWETVDADTTFEDLGIDSLSILDLLYDVDQEFGVELEAKDVIDLRTVGEIAALLTARLAE